MDLETICGSSNTSFKRQQQNYVQDVLIKWKKRKIYAVRDFPHGRGQYERTTLDRLNDPLKAEITGSPVKAEGLNDPIKAEKVTASGLNDHVKSEVTAKRLNGVSVKAEITANTVDDPVKAEIIANRLDDPVKVEITAHRLDDPVKPEVQGLTSYSGSDEALMAESVQKEGEYMPKALDDNRLLSLSKVVSSEANALTEKAMARISVRIYPPRRRISANRSYHKGCNLGGKATETCKDIEGELSASTVKVIEHNASCSENVLHEKKAVIDTLPRLYPPRRRISAIRCFPEGYGDNIPKSSNRIAKEAITSKTQ